LAAREIRREARFLVRRLAQATRAEAEAVLIPVELPERAGVEEQLAARRRFQAAEGSPDQGVRLPASLDREIAQRTLEPERQVGILALELEGQAANAQLNLPSPGS